MALPKPLIGAPLTATGGVFSAPVGSAVPTDNKTALDKAFEALGLVGQDGVTTNEDNSTEDVRDWSGQIVRTLQTDSSFTVELEFLETSLKVLKVVYGAGNVTSAADMVTVLHNGEQNEARAFVFEMKDGTGRIRLVLPNAQVTSRDSRTFSKQDVIRYKVTITAYPDESGNAGYEYLPLAA